MSPAAAASGSKQPACEGGSGPAPCGGQAGPVKAAEVAEAAENDSGCSCGGREGATLSEACEAEAGCGCGEDASPPELCGCGCGEAQAPPGPCEAAESGSSCGCGDDCASKGEAKPHKKAALVVAGAFTAASLVAEYVLGSEALMMACAAIAIAAGLTIVLPKTARSLKARSLDINVLMVVAVAGAVYVRAFEEAAAVLFLFSVGEWLEGRALKKSNDAIKDLAKLAPDTALVARDGEVHRLPTDQVGIGETVIVKPGMAAPLDGVVVKGASSFNDAAVTGESIPVYKGVGDAVFAGSLALDGSCSLQATSTIADSTLAKIAALVQDAQKQKSAREHFVQRFAKIYTPLVIGAALLVAAVPLLLSAAGIVEAADADTWIYRACELLVISCPCAFVISTPVTFVSALARAARLGVLVKGGAFFEEAVRVAVAAFDKTGTLTEGKPAVTKALAHGAGGLSLRQVVEVAEVLESHSAHPLGVAVVGYAQQQGIGVAAPADDLVETAGRGIAGRVGGVLYAIGSPGFIAGALRTEPPAPAAGGEAPGSACREEAACGAKTALGAEAARGGEEGAGEGLGDEDPAAAFGDIPEDEVGSTLLVARIDPSPQVVGAFVVSDVVRGEAAAVMAALPRVRAGIKTVMLTGDNAAVAAAVARQVGIGEVHAALLPQDKAERIGQLQAQAGPVAFVGDGINDAPSLAAADVGIAMGGAGTATALSSADVVLMADDLSALPKFFALSEKTVRVLRQNVALAIGLKALVALLVVAGLASMWMAVLADTGVSLLVIANGMRLLKVRVDTVPSPVHPA
ncbi:MAG: cation-translocating P-type ATPase [Eggerthellaceae bacterium]|nr:cation-translocating P-type ATPase [Eggerthellaceae bacterium]